MREEALNLLTNQFINSVTFSEMAEILIAEGRYRAGEKIKNLSEEEISELINIDTKPIEKKTPMPTISLKDVFVNLFKRIFKKPAPKPPPTRRFTTSKG